jgi:Tfp pilus assembly protein PilO
MMNAACVRPSHRKQQLWVCVIAGLFLGDFILCGYMPSRERLTSLREARAQQQRTIEMAAAQNVELAGLKTRLHSTEKLVERFDAYMPPDEALGEFLRQITTIMESNRLSDPVVIPGKKAEVGELGCIPVLMTCKGALTDLFELFNRLQTMGRLVRIEKVTMENDAGFGGQLAIRIQAAIFYQSKLLKAAGAGNAGSMGEANNGS